MIDIRNLSNAELAKYIQFTSISPAATRTDMVKHAELCAFCPKCTMSSEMKQCC
jgi:NAD(P)-dependent dehydrogenase (short-subunit alcohol dehydrogenase family)